MLLHVRVVLPDRPGALAALTRGLAGSGADIVHISVLDSEAGRVVDDVYLTCSAGHSSSLFLAVACLPEVDLVGLRVAERPPGPLADLFLLEQLLAQDGGGLSAVIDALPYVLGADWAVAIRGAECLARSLGAPPQDAAWPLAQDNPGAHRCVRVSIPLGATDVVITVGRDEDFPFHRTEVAHLHRLLAVVSAMLCPIDVPAAPRMGAA